MSLSDPVKLDIPSAGTDQCYIIDLDGDNSQVLYKRWFSKKDDKTSEEIMTGSDWNIPLNKQAEKDTQTLIFDTAETLRAAVQEKINFHEEDRFSDKMFAAYQAYQDQYPKIIMLFSMSRKTIEEGKKAREDHKQCLSENKPMLKCLKPDLTLSVAYISIFWSGVRHQLEQEGTYDRVPGKDLIRAAVHKIHSVYPYLMYVNAEGYTEGSKRLYKYGLKIEPQRDAVKGLYHYRTFPIELFESCVSCGKEANFVVKNMIYYCGLSCFEKQNK